MDKRRIWATVLALAAIGCGDSGAGGAGAGGAGSGGGDGGGGGGPPACDPGLLCLDVALVMVVSDFDGDGSIGVADLAEPGTIVGIANTAVVSGSATFAITPPPFGDVFPKGLNEGIAAYRIHEDGAYEPSPGGTRFTLEVGPDVF